MKSLLIRLANWLKQSPEQKPRPYAHVRTRDLVKGMNHAEAHGYTTLYKALLHEYNERIEEDAF